MPLGWLDHNALQIIKGVPKLAGYVYNNEPDLLVCNLLSNSTGITLTADGWSPNIPSLKSSGVWADSPISDGRTLLSGTMSNVIETMRVNVTGATFQEFAGFVTLLNTMVVSARDFWQTEWQINPVYLKWWASCAPGEQYALIYNIDIDWEYQDSPTPSAIATLSIEREYGWRAIAPGDNPHKWAYYINGRPDNALTQAKANMAYVVATGLPDSGGWVGTNSSLYNSVEYNAGFTATDQVPYLDIPASKIPGDLPALCLISISSHLTSGAHDSVAFWRTTKPSSMLDYAGNTHRAFLFMNANSAGLGTDTTNAADTGASDGNRGSCSFGTSTALVERLYWSWNATSLLNPSTMAAANLYRGRYRVWLRCRLSAAGTCGIQFRMSYSGVATTLTTTNLTDAGAGGTGNTTEWAVLDLGQIVINPDKRASSNSGGFGIHPDTLRLSIFASRTSGTPVLYFDSLILIGMDEPSVIAYSPNIDIDGLYVFYDNTGYLAHGSTDERLELHTMNVVGSNLIGQPQGVITPQFNQPFTLLPNVNNRIYAFDFDTASRRSAATSNSYHGLSVLAVPRWSGIRDT